MDHLGGVPVSAARHGILSECSDCLGRMLLPISLMQRSTVPPLPIVLQRASCPVRPCSVNERLPYFRRSKKTCGRVINPPMVWECRSFVIR